MSIFRDPVSERLSQEKIKIQLNGFVGSSKSILSSSIIKDSKSPQLFILNDKESANYFINDLENLIKHEVFFYPASYRRTYQIEETDNSNILLRAEVLNKLNNKRNSIIVSYPEAISEKVVSRKILNKKTITLSIFDTYHLDSLEKILIENNFTQTDFVTDPGQFSIRGGILDVFSYADENPFRIEFYDNEIESIRLFNINTQLSIERREQISIIPNTDAKKVSEKKVSFLEYLPQNATIWIDDILHTAGILQKNFDKAEEEFKKLSSESKILHISANEIFTNANEFTNQIINFRFVNFSSNIFFESDFEINSNIIPLTSINKKFDILFNELVNLQNKEYKNIIMCSSEEQKERFEQILENEDREIHVTTIVGNLHEGFIDHNNKIAIYTDHQIFNRHHRFKSKTKFADKQAITLKQLTNLKIGDFVTHIDHGIGEFSGLHKIENNGKKQESIKLIYKGGDILYISVHSLHKISKYSGKEGHHPSVNQLGSSKWQTTKNKTKNRIKKIAYNLIQLYAKRKTIDGFSYSPDTYLQHELEASFMWEDTPDQTSANIAIKEDMEKNTPMDRLVCGDVGFGKTEIAIRAAFKAITDNKQVAVLVPTTILALQHYKTFKTRLKEFACNVDYINRFKTTKQQNETIKELSEGKIDILIGTHRIVGKDIKFKDLGLLIIDEEQKFGVNIKDKLKKLKSNVDILTLSATPIPRTLQFSLLGARDLSVINTPPPNRIAIKTEIVYFDEEIIRDAIQYEISRNGQVFFIHNRIENIKEVASTIQRLVPNAKVKIGHGQLDGKILEELMIGFIEGDYDVLISTTIVENGVDVPNANTIIINNAHNFGLSDLHQMRGRVGRSNRQAFCYLISPPSYQLSNDSRKRLNALEQFSNLGSGFSIAMRDLDIRGAGDLLGADQSGFINEIGFEMYQKILNEAVEELKQEKFNELFSDSNQEYFIKDCQIDTDLEILIPDTYIANVEERLNIYKDLISITEEEKLQQFKKNLEDRFGEIPKPVEDLISSMKLKWISRKLGFERLLLKNKEMRAYFTTKKDSLYFSSDSFGKILEYLKQNFKTSKMKENSDKLILIIENIYSANKAIEVCNNIWGIKIRN
ncbi:MAG: transcription-repair coupling factor [Flavobacteriales bacterium]|nr:transcription-repair coupling factor [Flavobacteriales bacterium]